MAGDVTSNDASVRDQLADHHTHLGTYLLEMGRNMQAISTEWNGPASDGFEAFRKQLAAWCDAGRTYLDTVAQAHRTINDQYQSLNTQAASSYNANTQ